MDKNERDNPDKVMRKIESVETILWGQIALDPNAGAGARTSCVSIVRLKRTVQQLLVMHLQESFLPIKIDMQILLL